MSGEIGEETAVQAMRNGANDYLLKSNLARLSPALDLAIGETRGRRLGEISGVAVAAGIVGCGLVWLLIIVAAYWNQRSRYPDEL